MNSTREENLLALMRLPWTVKVAHEKDGSWSATVDEIPDAIATADDGNDYERELAADLWQSLYESLAVRLDHSDEIPLPPGSQLPWLVQPQPTVTPKPKIAGVVLQAAAYLPRPVSQAVTRDFKPGRDFALAGT
jgi:hypothetical protein